MGVMRSDMYYAAERQVNSAQWQAKRSLGLMTHVVDGALTAQVKTYGNKHINLGFQPALSIPADYPRLQSNLFAWLAKK